MVSLGLVYLFILVSQAGEVLLGGRSSSGRVFGLRTGREVLSFEL